MRSVTPLRSYLLAICSGILMLCLASCASVPKETVELSNTVGRDLEEVHRAHRAIADRYFDLIEADIEQFIDDVYAPTYISTFAKEFHLEQVVTGILKEKPENLLPVLTDFVTLARINIGRKRMELVTPLKEQRKKVIARIDDAHRQIQAAQAILTGHLASVVKVHEAQNELMKKAGLDGLREEVAQKTADISDKVAELVDKGEEVNGKMDEVEEVLHKIKDTLKKESKND